MLYRGSEITREVAWVIFDEIHYLRDKGRGKMKLNRKFYFLALFLRTWCYMGRNNYFIT
jgi:hypothetical protein